jgi:diaminopimelate epimerase
MSSFSSFNEKMSLTSMSKQGLKFYKYHGCGNDFIIIDQVQNPSDFDSFHGLSEQKIRELCTWHTGIGADGLIFLMPSHQHSFRMDYYNADGRLGSLCGNGSRCAVRCAYDLGMRPDNNGIFRFEAHDGDHFATIEDDLVTVSLHDFPAPITTLHGWFVNNGSPHFLIPSHELNEINVDSEGKLWRHHSQFNPGGTNVNFIQILAKSHLKIRTFERGVERETMACGTGVTAAAAWYASFEAQESSTTTQHAINIEALGGHLQVNFTLADQVIKDVQLTGPATSVFEGYLSI